MSYIRETGKIAGNTYIIDALSWGIEKQNAVYFIIGENRNILIDSGLRSSDAKRINNFINKNLACPKIDYIIITHGHLDHTGGLSYFLKKYDSLKIILSEKSSNLIKEINNIIIKKGLSTQINPVKEGSEVNIGPEYNLRILETPGHSPDHISIFDLLTKFLYVGDSAGAYHIGMKFSRPTAYVPDFQYNKYLETLNRFISLSIEGIGIASYGFVKEPKAKALLKFGLKIFNQWYYAIKKCYEKGLDIDETCEQILEKFGKSPGEIKENRPDSWIKRFLTSSIRGFMDAIKKNSIEKKF